MYTFDKATHLKFLCKILFGKRLVRHVFCFRKKIHVSFEYFYVILLDKKDVSQFIVIQKQID